MKSSYDISSLTIDGNTVSIKYKDVDEEKNYKAMYDAIGRDLDEMAIKTLEDGIC